MLSGIGLAVVALALSTQLHAGAGYGQIVVCLVLLGLGLGHLARVADHGVAGGRRARTTPARPRVWSTSCSRSGRRSGLAVLVTVLDATAGHSQLGAGVGAAASLVHGLDVTFAVAALFALAALVMVATLVKLPALEPRTTVCAEAEGLEVGLVDGEGFEWADPELVA